MKILVVCQYYAPEPFRINDICEEMVKRGHEVTVVTGEPNYPDGDIYPGYEKHRRSDGTLHGVTVHRCPIVPRKKGILHRFLNYYSYLVLSKRYIRTLPDDFDVVFVNQLSPVMMAGAGIEYGKRWKKPVILYCLDLWPESLIAGGIKRNSILYRFFHRISKNIYRNVDKILIASKGFRQYLVSEFQIEDSRISYLPQYAESVFEYAEPRQPDGIYHLLFAGNIGTAQSVDTIIDAASKLEDAPVMFDIVGSGIELERLKKKAGKNVTFHGRKPVEEMPAFYRMADAMLVTLRADPVLSLTLPGKVQSYMAAGRPIIGAADGETRTVIEEALCGYCGRAEDADELVKSIRLFMESSEKAQMGRNARKYYQDFFERGKFVDQLENELMNGMKNDG